MTQRRLLRELGLGLELCRSNLKGYISTTIPVVVINLSLKPNGLGAIILPWPSGRMKREVCTQPATGRSQ